MPRPMVTYHPRKTDKKATLDSFIARRFNTRSFCGPHRENKNAQVAQSVEQWTENPRVGGSIPPLGTSEINSVVECHLAKVKVASSNLVFRSNWQERYVCTALAQFGAIAKW